MTPYFFNKFNLLKSNLPTERNGYKGYYSQTKWIKISLSLIWERQTLLFLGESAQLTSPKNSSCLMTASHMPALHTLVQLGLVTCSTCQFLSENCKDCWNAAITLCSLDFKSMQEKLNISLPQKGMSGRKHRLVLRDQC